VDLLIWLSRANCLIRVPSQNQRSTSTAWSWTDKARVWSRVPRRARSAASSPARNSTVWSRTGRVAVYVTLILGAELHMKLICGRTTFIPGFCVFLLHRNGSGVAPPGRHVGYIASLIVTRNGSLSSAARIDSTRSTNNE
jgi:hypothetical protein